MAFDVLRSQNSTDSGRTFPSYSFYSGIKDRYVSVTLQSDGDTSSQFAEIEDAVAFYNKVPGVPEVTIRNDTDTSPLKKTYAFDYNGNVNRKSAAQSIEKTIFINENRADIVAKLHLLNSYVDECDDNTPISRDDFLNISSILRSLSITQLADLNNYFPQNIPVTDFLNVDTLSGLGPDEVASLHREVPELSQYIDFNNIRQSDIDLAVANISNLGAKLGLNIGVSTDIPENLGDLIMGLPGIDAFLGETTENGKEYFPDGVNSSSIANSNFSFFEITDVNVPDANEARIDELIREGKAFFNPLGSVLTDIEQANASAETALAYAETITSNSKILDTKQALDLLKPALDGFTAHLTKLTTVVPTPTVSSGLSLGSALGTSLKNLIENPLGGLDGDTAGSFEAVAAVETSAQYVAGQSASDDGDWDSLDPQSGFKLTSVDPIIGSLVSPEYRLLVNELLMVVNEISNYNTDRTYMCRCYDALVVRYTQVKQERQLVELILQGTDTHSELVAAENALAKVITYFSERISNSISMDANTVGEKIVHFDLVGSWAPGVINYYNRQLQNVVVAETSGYRSATTRTQRSSILDKSKAGATLINTIATPELNQAARDIIRVDDNIIRTSIPLQRVQDDDFLGQFKLSHFVNPEMGAANRLRNFERDYKGEINTFTSEDLKNNLRAINNDVLAPLAEAGFEFDIVRGLRPFKHEKGKAGKYNNSDHHYGLAVDIKLKDPNLTGIAAAYIKEKLPWNKLVLYNFNQGSKANSDAYIHISYYNRPSHGWDKNIAIYPRCGKAKVIGGNGVSVPGFIDLETSAVIDIPALPDVDFQLQPESVQAIHLDSDDIQGIKIKLGLGNVNNTSDANKPISIATQQALTNIYDLIDNIETEIPDDSIEPIKLKLSSAAGFRTRIGLGNVNNTSDSNKPVSIAQQAAIDTAIVDLRKEIFTGDEIILTSSTLITALHNRMIIVANAISAISLTLSSPALLGDGWMSIITNTGSDDITVQGTFDDGTTDVTLVPGGSMMVQSNGTVHRLLLRGGAGDAPTPGSGVIVPTRETIIGDGGDTYELSVFPPNKDSVLLFIGGAIQSKSSFTITGNELVVDEPVDAGEIIEVYTVVFGPSTLGVAPLYEKHNGTNSAGPFTLQIAPYSSAALRITIGGISQPRSGAYTVVGDQITFSDPISSLTYWEAEILQPVGIGVGEVDDDSITAEKINSNVGPIRTKLSVDSSAEVDTKVGTRQPLDSDLTAIAALTTTSFGRDFLTLADAPAGRLKLSVDSSAEVDTKIGTRQPLDSDLTAIATLTTTSFGRDFLTLADPAAARFKLIVDSSSEVTTKVSNAVTGLVDSAPTIHNTLGKLSTALGTTDTAVAGKQPLSATLTAIASAGFVPDAQLPARLQSVPPSVITDFNLATSSGYYMGGSTTANGPGVSMFWAIHVYTYNANYLVQETWEVNTTGGTGMFRRQRSNGVWSPWQNLVDERRQWLGTVSQSSGIPTGAIFEKGSNANGDYIRYADGTQICWKTLSWSGAYGSIGNNYVSPVVAGGSWPANFISQPALGVSGTDGGGDGWPSQAVYHNATYPGTWRISKGAPPATSYQMWIVATGRWY